MKSFLADSNSRYIQTIDLPAGQYTFSAIVKSPNMLYSFAIEEIGGWRTFDLNLQTTEFKKVSIQFLTAKVTKIDLVSNNASASNVIEIVSPMLNGGTIASPAKRHELDLTELITSQEIFTQYSVDGSLNWHTTYVAGDRYMRTKKGEGNWSAPMLFVGEDGAVGADGKYTEIEFAKNTSTTTAPTSGWQDAPPTASEGEYVWMRQGEVIPPATTPSVWSPAVRLTGVKGTNGTNGSDGVSVTSVVIQYAKNTSATVAPTSGWGSTRPVWESGTYLWQRTFTTYSNETTSAGTASLDNTWQAEGKIVELENTLGAFSAPTIDPESNTVLSGNLLVGNEIGTQAGISGLGTSGNSVRFFAGSTFANRETADWLIRDDGVEEQWFNGVLVRQRGVINGAYVEAWYNLNGQIGKKITFNPDGKILEEWYNNGSLVYQIGQNGIYYVSEIPESYTPIILIDFSTNASPVDQNALKNAIKLRIWQKSSDPTYFELRGSYEAFEYNAGRNVYSEYNKQFEGYKKTQSLNNNINNGWYSSEQKPLQFDGLNPNELIVPVTRFLSGKNTQTIFINIPTQGYYFNQF